MEIYAEVKGIRYKVWRLLNIFHLYFKISNFKKEG
jgi:hypothetical protein